MSNTNAVAAVENFWRNVWQPPQNPDAIDRLVAEDFVLTSGGIDFISRATGAQLAEIRDGGRRILACGHLQPGLPIMPNCPRFGLQERAIRRMPDNLPQVRGSSGKCRMEALMIRGVVYGAISLATISSIACAEDLATATTPLAPGTFTTSAHSDEWKIANALSAGPASITEHAAVMDWPANAKDGMSHGRALRQGANGWTCMPDVPGRPQHDPMCADETMMKWLTATLAGKKPDIDRVGLSYMLLGDPDGRSSGRQRAAGSRRRLRRNGHALGQARRPDCASLWQVNTFRRNPKRRDCAAL